MLPPTRASATDHCFTGASRKGIGLQTGATRSTSEPGTHSTTWTKNSVVASTNWPLWTDPHDAEVNHRCIYSMVRAEPHPLPATCWFNYDGTDFDVIPISHVRGTYLCIYIFRRLWLPGYPWMHAIISWMLSFPYNIHGIWNGYLLHILFCSPISFAGDMQMAFCPMQCEVLRPTHFGG